MDASVAYWPGCVVELTTGINANPPKIRGEVLSLNNPGPIELIFLHWWVCGNELDGDDMACLLTRILGNVQDGKDVHPPDLSVNQRHQRQTDTKFGPSVTQINVVLNWFEELKQKVPLRRSEPRVDWQTISHQYAKSFHEKAG